MESMEFSLEMNVMSVDLLDKVFIKILILKFTLFIGYAVKAHSKPFPESPS